jgi:serine/threonine-protein kinase PRP4
MLKIMMEYRGRFPKKLLRAATFRHVHFDENLNFLQTEREQVIHIEF